MQDTFAGRLTTLRDRFRQPPNRAGIRREWPLARVAAEAAIAPSYIGMLRDGTREPSLQIVRALAGAFEKLSAESGTPVSAKVLFAYLAGEADVSALDQPRSAVVRLMARQGDLNTPGMAELINQLLDDFHAEDEANKKTWFRRLRKYVGGL